MEGGLLLLPGLMGLKGTRNPVGLSQRNLGVTFFERNYSLDKSLLLQHSTHVGKAMAQRGTHSGCKNSACAYCTA